MNRLFFVVSDNEFAENDVFWDTTSGVAFTDDLGGADDEKACDYNFVGSDAVDVCGCHRCCACDYR